MEKELKYESETLQKNQRENLETPKRVYQKNRLPSRNDYKGSRESRKAVSSFATTRNKSRFREESVLQKSFEVVSGTFDDSDFGGPSTTFVQLDEEKLTRNDDESGKNQIDFDDSATLHSTSTTKHILRYKKQKEFLCQFCKTTKAHNQLDCFHILCYECDHINSRCQVCLTFLNGEIIPLWPNFCITGGVGFVSWNEEFIVQKSKELEGSGDFGNNVLFGKTKTGIPGTQFFKSRKAKAVMIAYKNKSKNQTDAASELS